MAEETIGGVLGHLGGVVLGSQHGVRTHEGTVPALDAGLVVPHRDDLADVAFLVAGGPRRVGAVDGQRRDRQLVAAPGQHRRGDLPHERRGIRRDGRDQVPLPRRAGGHLDLVQVGQGGVDRLVVLLHDGHRLAGVGLGDGGLDLLDGLLTRHDTGDREETGLQHRVGARPETRGPRNRGGVDDVKGDTQLYDPVLHRARQLLPHLIRRIGRVDQQRRTGLGELQHVHPLQDRPVMAADEVRPGHQIRRLDRVGAESQMRDGA